MADAIPMNRCVPMETGEILESCQVSWSDALQMHPEKHSRLPMVSVCHIASGDVWGGAEVQVATLARQLSNHPSIALCVILLNEGRLAQELRENGVEVKVISEKGKQFLQVFAEAAEFLKDKKIEILHSHRYKENLLALLLARRLRIAHLVRTQHGRPERFPGFMGLKQWLYYAMDRQLAKYTADRVICVSSDLTSYLKTHLSQEKIAVIHNGIDLKDVHSDLSPAAAKKRLNLSEDATVFGVACRLQPVKRLDLFLLTASHIAEQLPDAVFLIAGAGREEVQLGKLIQNSNLQGRVFLLGHRDDPYAVLRAMDVMLITSDHEGLPMVLLEAMAIGVPVVSRKVGGIPEVIQDRVSGLLVSSADPSILAGACLSIVKDQRFRSSLVQAARNVVARDYSSAKNAGDVVRLYRSLL